MAKAKEAAPVNVDAAAEEGVCVETASAPKKEAKGKEGYEDILVPKNFLTGPDDEHIPVVLNGKIYQVKLGETVSVPKGVAGILKNAMAQKANVDKLIKKRASSPKALN